MRGAPEHLPPTSSPGGAGADALRERLLQQRIVLIAGPLTAERAGDLIGELLLLSSQDPVVEIRLYVNSGGGDGGAFLGCYDAVQTLSAPVATICVSQAKGTAALLVAAGTPGKRLAFRHSSTVLGLPRPHLDEGIDVDAQLEHARSEKQLLIDIAARHTGRSTEDVAADLERGLLLSAEEAKAYGLLDDVIDPSHPYFARFPLPRAPGGNGG